MHKGRGLGGVNRVLGTGSGWRGARAEVQSVGDAPDGYAYGEGFWQGDMAGCRGVDGLVGCKGRVAKCAGTYANGLEGRGRGGGQVRLGGA